MTAYILVPADDDIAIREVKVAGDPLDSFSELIAAGGTVERVQMAQDANLWVSENGIAEGLGFNSRASLLTIIGGRPAILVGDAIVTGGTSEDGETENELDDEQIGMLNSLLTTS